jgi:hypothetical protein
LPGQQSKPTAKTGAGVKMLESRLASFRKTVLAAAGAAIAAGVASFAINSYLPGLGAGVAAIVAVLAGSVAASGLLTLHRAHRTEANAPDLFLELNRSQTPQAVAASEPRRRTFRRQLGRLLLGHDLLVGDEVEVCSLTEIRATLDSGGAADGLPFMPEMTKFCGARARVFRCADKIYDYGRTKKMRRLEGSVLLVGLRCDGAAHGGCQAECLLIWKACWLRRIPPGEGSAARPIACAERRAAPAVSAAPEAPSSAPPAAVRFTCQFTQLQAATHEFRRWDLRRELRPLVAGNVSLAAFLVALATRWFNTVQTLRGGETFPLTPRGLNDDCSGKRPVAVGDVVAVCSLDEIARTLDANNKNRGLWFDRDMVKHCGQQYRVQARVECLIDAATGGMVQMKLPCIVLEGVDCSGEFQYFGAQHEYIYWREAWLTKPSPPHSQTHAS